MPVAPSLLIAARSLAGPAVYDRRDLASAQADVAQRAVIEGMQKLHRRPLGPALPVTAPGPSDPVTSAPRQGRQSSSAGRELINTRHEPLLRFCRSRPALATGRIWGKPTDPLLSGGLTGS